MDIKKFMYERFVKRHGKGEDNQSLIYRCLGCGHLVTWNKIRDGGCGCGVNRIVPTYPGIFEQFRLFVFPRSI